MLVTNHSIDEKMFYFRNMMSTGGNLPVIQSDVKEKKMICSPGGVCSFIILTFWVQRSELHALQFLNTSS